VGHSADHERLADWETRVSGGWFARKSLNLADLPQCKVFNV
jgi:hypothetical protein